MDTEGDRIIINVGGKRHETYSSTLQNIPDTRLAWLAESFLNGNRQELFFDRNPKIFGIILNYYRTGQLHAPRDFCGPLFEEELAFWGINEQQMEACCWPFYTQHRDAEKNLKDFVGPEFEDSDDDDDDEIPPDIEASYGHGSTSSYWTIYRPKLWALLDDAHSSTAAKVFAVFSLLMILASVVSMCASSVLPDNQHIQGFDYAFCTWFTLELVARLVFCPDKIAFFKEIMTWVDFISLLPFYGSIIFPSLPYLNFLRPVRLIRIFRALKFFVFTSGLQIIVQSLKASFRELVLLLIILLIPVVVFSSVLFEIEKDNAKQPHFKTIPEAFWWAIITMTTVGYGDMVPITIPGRIVGGLCAICGVLIVALPVSVIGNNFSTYYSHAQARLSLPKKKRRLIVGDAKLRIGALPGQTTSSTASLAHHGNQEMTESYNENKTSSEDCYSQKYRRYHRRSRNTLFASGDVYIGPGSLLDRSRVKRGNSCAEAENESENDKNECATLKETVEADDSERTAAPDSRRARSPTPRLTLIQNTQESEEIIEENTTRGSLSNRCNGVPSTKREKPFSPNTRHKKTYSGESRSSSWAELKDVQSPVEHRRTRSSLGFKSRVTPATDETDSNQNHSLTVRRFSPSLINNGPLLRLEMENTRLDTSNRRVRGHDRRAPNAKIVNNVFQKKTTTSEHEFSNGHVA